MLTLREPSCLQISGTISLLMRCGLHQIKSSSWQDLALPAEEEATGSSVGLAAPLSRLRPPPPKDNIEVGERICVFWLVCGPISRSVSRILTPTFQQFYAVEIMTGLVTGLAPNQELVDNAATVWPKEFDEYEQVRRTKTFLLTSLYSRGCLQDSPYSSPDGLPSDLFQNPPPPPFDPPCASYALRCKGLVLLARVSTFATSCTPGTSIVRLSLVVTR